MAEVAVRGVSKVFPGGIEALTSVDLAVADGERFAILGPSGSGKSTVLRLIAGLERCESGTIAIGGRRVEDEPPRGRDVAMVFQNPALYPYLSVFENLAFGLRARRTPRAEIGTRVREAAALLALEPLLERRPGQLSGGERQRVALGRAIVRRPKVFLLDEPFSGLDAPLRSALRRQLLELHRRLGTTMVYVTHDQADALALGERLAILDRGRLVQAGSPGDVYERPSTRFVAGFLGSPPMNFLAGTLSADGPALRFRPDGTGHEWLLPPQAPSTGSLRGLPGGRVELGLRPEHVRCSGAAVPAQTGDVWTFEGRVLRVEPEGRDCVVAVEFGPHELAVVAPPESRFRPGDSLPLAFPPERALWFDPTNGRALRAETSGGPEPEIAGGRAAS